VIKLPIKERERPPRPMLKVLMILTRLIPKRIASEWVLASRSGLLFVVKGSALVFCKKKDTLNYTLFVDLSDETLKKPKINSIIFIT